MAALVAGGLLLDRPREWLAPLAAAAGASPGAPGRGGGDLLPALVRRRPGHPPRRAARDRLVAERLGGGAAAAPARPAAGAGVRWLVLSQAVTVCAALGTAPLTAWHFNQMSLVAPLANLVVVPLLGVVTVGLGLLGTARGGAGPSARRRRCSRLVGLAVRRRRPRRRLAARRCPGRRCARHSDAARARPALRRARRAAAAARAGGAPWSACCACALAVDAAAWAVERTRRRDAAHDLRLASARATAR